MIAERAESVFPAGVFLAGLKLLPVGLECVQKGAELTWCESCEPGEGVGLCDELTVEEVGSHAGIVPEDRSLSGSGCFAGDLLFMFCFGLVAVVACQQRYCHTHGRTSRS